MTRSFISALSEEEEIQTAQKPGGGFLLGPQ